MLLLYITVCAYVFRCFVTNILITANIPRNKFLVYEIRESLLCKCLHTSIVFVLQPTLDFFGRKVTKQVKETTVKTEGNTMSVVCLFWTAVFVSVGCKTTLICIVCNDSLSAVRYSVLFQN